MKSGSREGGEGQRPSLKNHLLPQHIKYLFTKGFICFFFPRSLMTNTRRQSDLPSTKKFHQRRIKTSPLSGARPRIISADQSHYLFEVGQVLERPTDETVTIIKRLGEKLIIIEAVCLSKSMTGSPDGWAGRRGTRTNAFFIPSSICIYLTFTVLEDILRWY